MSGIDRCDAASRRSHDYSPNETSCDPSNEKQVAAAEDARNDAERAAEAKRNAYFASDEDVGGQCRSASSAAGVVPTPKSDDDTRLRDALRTKAIDPPLKDDPIGNAIVGAVAGGIGAGVRAAATECGAGVVGRSVAAHIAEETGKKLAGKAVTTTVKTVAGDAIKQHGIDAGRRAYGPPPPPEAPSRSAEPPVIGPDRVPYAPDHAPVRIPEAPMPVVIRG